MVYHDFPMILHDVRGTRVTRHLYNPIIVFINVHPYMFPLWSTIFDGIMNDFPIVIHHVHDFPLLFGWWFGFAMAMAQVSAVCRRWLDSSSGCPEAARRMAVAVAWVEKMVGAMGMIIGI